MTKEEVKKVVDELLEENDPEVVAQGFMHMYVDGKIEIEDLLFIVDCCGFELDQEFIDMPREEVKKHLDEEEGDEFLEEEGKPEEESKEESKEESEEDRASKAEGYDGKKVYDKQGNPSQPGPGTEEGSDEEEAEKLYNLKFNK